MRMSTSSSGGACSKEVYTEETPISPTTHLPGARFYLSGGLPPPAKNKGKGTVRDAYAELEGNDFVDAGGEVEIENEDEAEDEAGGRLRRSRDAAASTCNEEGSRGKEKSKSKKVVPVPRVHYPFSVSAEDGGAGTGVLTSPRDHESERERNVTLSPHGVFTEDP
ncbi:hypothetical protein B0H14DRAFT_2872377 [Mycena olivaceomarginata]|nr:hypothetical protein B0H14DRAFT_2872377 [Mycena olivaceomarginata]